MNAPLALRQVLQRHVRLAGRLVVQHRVAMEERAAAAVLAGQPHLVAGLEQARIGHHLGEAPVHRQLAGGHPRAVVHDARDLRMQREPGGHTRDLGEERPALALRNSGDDRRIPVALAVAAPVHRVCVADHAEHRLGQRLALVEPLAILLREPLRIGRLDDTGLDERAHVDLARRRVLPDDLVHLRLRGGGLVRLVVAMTPVADEIDDEVLVEGLAILERQARDEHGCLRVVAVHVEHRRFDHLGDIAAVFGGARVARIADRESHLVVDDQVHGTAGRETAKL